MANTLAYGFVGLDHLMAERVTTVGVQTIDDAITASISEWNRGIDSLLAGTVRRTTDHQFRYQLPSGGTLQPLDEWGNPLPVRPAGYFDVALPIQGGGTAWGDNRITRALMTVADANRFTVQAQQQDADWLRRHILASIFTNTTWTFDDPQYGNLTIQPLANNDTVPYLRVGGSSSAANHYLAQAGAIADATNPFPTIYSTLTDYQAATAGPVVAYVPTANVAAVEALTNFREVGDPDVEEGISTARLVGTIDRGFGDQVLGKVDKVWVIEWRALPDNYLIAHNRGAGDFLGMREYPASQLQGFFTEMHSPDGNKIERRMLRYAGFGVINRIAALVQLVGNGSYAIPTGYSAPLAV